MRRMGYDIRVEVLAGETSRLNVIGEGAERDVLGALIGRKGERLSALQHLVNLMLSKQIGEWTRVLVDVEDYRGRRERQLAELARRAAERVVEHGQDAPARADARPRAALDPPRPAGTIRTSPRSPSVRSRTGASWSCRETPDHRRHEPRP